MTTNELAEASGLARSSIRSWCRKNNIRRKLGGNGVMEYDLSEKDLKKFENRKKPGWEKGKPRKAE